jgi:ADP-dependent NAD(P)H-hydrate dehydratase
LVFALPETRDGRPSARAADVLAEHVAGWDALLVGPGMMRDEEGMARAMLDLASIKPIVVDAGALNAVEAASARPGDLILTPMPARWLDCSRSTRARSRPIP